jgi:hypothetical protein
MIEQCMHLNAYEEHAIYTFLELERLGCERYILCQGTFMVHKKE